MNYKVTSEVIISDIVCKHTYIQDFSDKDNVFCRVLLYHNYMNKMFPNSTYKVLSCVPINHKEKQK
jgi:hypothetical protein